MNCLMKKYFQVSILTIFFLNIFLQGAFANYSSLTIYPAEGTIYGDSSRIEIFLDTGEVEFTGFNVNLSYSGNVQYIAAEGEEICAVFAVVEGIGAVNIECRTNEGFNQAFNGKIANLYFKATDTGSSIFSFSIPNPNVNSIAAITYSLSTDPNPEGVQLPDTGIFGSLGSIVVGLIILILGLFFNQFLNGYTFFSQKTREAATKKRRDRLEKDF